MRKIVAFLFLLFSQQPTANSQQLPSYLIVTPDNDGIRQWADTLARFRNEQGIATEVISINEIGENSPIVLNKYFKEIHDRYNLSAILLFGDYDNDSTNGITSFYLKIILKIMYIIFPIIN